MVGGPAAGVQLLVPNGLGVPAAPIRDTFGQVARWRKRFDLTDSDWFSREAWYLGPFGTPDALAGADRILAIYQALISKGRMDAPQIHLAATDFGIGIMPIDRDASLRIWLPYSTLASIELCPATVAKMLASTANTSHKLGQVTITTVDRHKATLSGTTVSGLFEFLQARGAQTSGPSEPTP